MADLDIADYCRDPAGVMLLLQNHYVPTRQLELIVDFVNDYSDQINDIDLWRMGQMREDLMTQLEPPENTEQRQEQQ